MTARDTVEQALALAHSAVAARRGQALEPVLDALIAIARDGDIEQYRDVDRLLEAELIASSRYAEVRDGLHAALSCAEPRAEKRIVAHIERRLGAAHDMSGDDVTALDWLERSREHFAEANDREGLARVTSSLGVLWARRGNLVEARSLLEDALRVTDSLAAPLEGARVRANLGYVYLLQQEYPRARQVLEESLAVTEPLKHSLQIIALLNLTRIDLAEGCTAATRRRLDHLEPLLGDGSSFARMEHELLRGLLALQEGRADEAVRILRGGIVMDERHDARREQYELWEALAEALEAAGDPAQALTALRRAHDIDVSLRREQAVVQAATARERRAAQRAREQADAARASESVLRETLARLERAQEDLHRVNDEKDALLAELRRQTREDPLTRLLNRRALDDELERECTRAARHGRPLTLALLDLDDFKQINDRHSHATGDRALVVIANCLSAARRASDVLARLGGEEFVLLLPETSAPQALQICERIRASIADQRWATLSIRPLTVSIGIVQLREGEGAAEFIRRADRAMYVAKQRGKNRIEVEPPST